ncbi:MAG TPA: hypothetical protein VMJ10_26875 [Kofleriaceae bacterium]|nr:hypothetical protein [Kofleriaceae bacterium]
MKLVALLVALAACDPDLSQLSVAPPGRAARLDEVHHAWHADTYRLEVSHGVALAFDCRDGGPCEHLHVVSENPAIAEVRPAALAQMQSAGWTREQTASAVVVIGRAPGKTRLHLDAAEGHREIDVTVVAVP